MKCLSVAKHIKQVQIAENSPKLLKKKKRPEVMVGDADGTVAEGEEVVNPKGQWSPGNVDVGTEEAAPRTCQSLCQRTGEKLLRRPVGLQTPGQETKHYNVLIFRTAVTNN